MNRAVVSGLIIMLSAYGATAQTPAKEAKIERLLSLTNSQAVMDQLFNQMKAMAASQVSPGSTPEQAKRSQEMHNKTLDLIRGRLSWDRMKPQFVKIYSEIFSDEEIDGMVSFYGSPAGKAMLQKMPAVMSRLMAVSQEQMRELKPELDRISRQAMQK